MKNKNMNIVLITDEYAPVGGGAGIVASNIYCRLKSKSGFKIYKRKPSESRFRYLLILFGFFIRLSTSNQKYKIIVNDYFSVCVVGMFIRLLGLLNVSLNKVDFYVLTHGSEVDLLKKQMFPKSIVSNKLNYTACIDKSKLLLFPSFYLRDKFIKNNLVPSNINTKVVYYGIDEFWFECFPLYSNRGKSKNILKIISVSRLIESKGYLNMLNAMIEATKSGIKIEWTIIGSGSYFGHFSKLCEKFKNQSLEINFLGKLTREDIRTNLRNNDLFILTPNKDEAFGLAYIEAISQGVPCIGSRHSGIVEAINNETGILVSGELELIQSIKDFDKDRYEPSDLVAWAKKFNSSTLLYKIEELIEGN